MSLLKVENLNQSYAKKQILSNISFDLSPGEVVAFLGPNGAGKTTLLRTVAGLLKLQEYSESNKLNLITFEKKCINKRSVSDRVSLGLLYLPQQTSLFRQMTVIDNLKLIFKYHNYWDNNRNKLSQFKIETDSWLDKTNLTNHKKQLAGSLSGGEKRKLEVIRSILMHPKAIMLDEPFTGVDPKSIYELKEIFYNMAKSNIAVLISDHNVDQLLSIASRCYVVIKGQIIKTGSIKDVINDNATKEMYFGYQFYKELSNKFL